MHGVGGNLEKICLLPPSLCFPCRREEKIGLRPLQEINERTRDGQRVGKRSVLARCKSESQDGGKKKTVDQKNDIFADFSVVR